MCGCASREVPRPWDSGQGTLCDPMGSCGASSCCFHIRSIQVDVASVYSIRPVIPICVTNAEIACSTGVVHSQGRRVVGIKRTFGIAAWPEKRRRTRLSIPFGLRHEGSTRM